MGRWILLFSDTPASALENPKLSDIGDGDRGVGGQEKWNLFAPGADFGRKVVNHGHVGIKNAEK